MIWRKNSTVVSKTVEKGKGMYISKSKKPYSSHTLLKQIKREIGREMKRGGLGQMTTEATGDKVGSVDFTLCVGGKLLKGVK